MEDPRSQQGPADPRPASEEVEAPSAKEVEDEICRDLMAIHTESYGRTAERATAHILGDTVVVVLDGLQLLPNEEFMIEHGHQDAVTRLREQYQKAIGSTFSAAVERATGQRVVAFASHVQIEEPRFMAEIFRLAPS